MIFRNKLVLVIAAVVFLCNCSNDNSDADSIAVKNITAAALAPDTTKIDPINEPQLNYIRPGAPTPLKNMFGINSYEWNFLENPGSPHDRNHIYEDKYALIKTFSAVRHYLNWNRIETTKGGYAFNPSLSGGWDYDIIYQRCKQDGILVLVDLKNSPEWLFSTFPASQRDNQDVAVVYGQSTSDPASYADEARTAFQIAARYGYNQKINPALVKVNGMKRWPGDIPNEARIGMGLVKYMECGNEPDRWWGPDEVKQSTEEYAANLSAFYDGNMGKLGANAGVKTADPSMQVVLGGLASADVKYLQGIIEWCKKNRGYKKDGSVNLCFDVINYHLYSNNGDVRTHKHPTTGVAPELCNAGTIANSFVNLANSLPQHPEVWLTENGYDINPASYQRADAIGKKTVLEQQADWTLRSSLFYIRYGIKRLFFYQLFDDHAGGTTQFATSGLNEGLKRRPAADYILQTSKLMGDYDYVKTIVADPLVDQYKLGKKTMYVLTIPDETGRTGKYTLNIGKAKANIYHLKIGADTMDESTVNTVNGKLTVDVTETPVFVEAAM